MTATSLQEIRRQLREKFPAAHGFAPVPEPVAEVSQTFFEPSAFPAGAISEIIPAAEGGGLSLWIAGLLAEPEEAAEFPKFVLVDGSDHFDPASHTAAACSQLLWVRCAKIQEALKAADLLVRDGNVPFVLLDLFRLGLGRRLDPAHDDPGAHDQRFGVVGGHVEGFQHAGGADPEARKCGSNR